MIPSVHFREDDRLEADFPVTPLRRWMHEERAQREALAGKLFDANAKIMELQNQRQPRRKKSK